MCRETSSGSDNGTARHVLWEYDRAAFSRHLRHLVADRGTLDCACGVLISLPRHACDIWDCMLSALQRMLCACSMHNDVQCGERTVNRSSIVDRRGHMQPCVWYLHPACCCQAHLEMQSRCTLLEACCLGAATESDGKGLRRSDTCAGSAFGILSTDRKF